MTHSKTEEKKVQTMGFKSVSKQKFEAIISKGIELDLCPMCKNHADIVVSIPWYGRTGAKVQCTKCGYSTKYFNIHSHFDCPESHQVATPILEKSLMIGIRSAIQSWNTRTQKEGE